MRLLRLFSDLQNATQLSAFTFVYYGICYALTNMLMVLQTKPKPVHSSLEYNRCIHYLSTSGAFTVKHWLKHMFSSRVSESEIVQIVSNLDLKSSDSLEKKI